MSRGIFQPTRRFANFLLNLPQIRHGIALWDQTTENVTKVKINVKFQKGEIHFGTEVMSRSEARRIKKTSKDLIF